jgi:hypothetical protein
MKNEVTPNNPVEGATGKKGTRRRKREQKLVGPDTICKVMRIDQGMENIFFFSGGNWLEHIRLSHGLLFSPRTHVFWDIPSPQPNKFLQSSTDIYIEFQSFCTQNIRLIAPSCLVST